MSKRCRNTAPRTVVPGLDRHIRRRVRLFAAVVAAVCFGGLAARLFTLQLIDPDHYAARAADQQLRDTVIPAPGRGRPRGAGGRGAARGAAHPGRYTVTPAPRG